MIPYILYAALVLTATFAFYKLLLQRQTFFHLNRFVLLACTALAFALPLLHVPQEWSFREAKVAEEIVLPKVLPHASAGVKSTIESPSKAIAPLPTIASSSTKSSIDISKEQIMQWVIFLYWFGAIIFALNFLLQLFVLYYRAYFSNVVKDGKFRIIEISDNKAPCSFGNNIFINASLYDAETYKQILLHEKIHITQKHTFDLLFAEIVLIFQWFNPFAWLWRKELENNLEYLTDNQLLQHDFIEKRNYQISLLKVAVPNFPLHLTTNYNQSTLKKRFIMMNAKKSGIHTIWKYFFILPVLILFVCLFNEPSAKSQTNDKDKTTKTAESKEEHNNIRTEGNWFATIKGDTIYIQFRDNAANDKNSYNGNSFLRSEFKDLPLDKSGSFTLTREAGTMQFTGKFDGNTGMGQYKFVPDNTYTNDMQKQGIELTDNDDAMVFFFVNVKRSYVAMLKENGYKDLDKDNIIPMAALDINEDYIKSIKSSLPNISMDDLIPFRSLGIDKTYIDEIHKAGYPNVSADKLITFKAEGIDGKYISDFRSSNKTENTMSNNNNNQNQENTSADDDGEAIVSYKSLGITPDYVQSIKSAGITDITSENIVSMKALGITDEYIKSIINAGFKNISADDVTSMKAQNISPSLISEYKAIGFTDISLDDIVSAHATGTTPELIKQYRDLGFKDQNLDDMVSAVATGTTPELIKQYRDLGFTKLQLDDLISAKSTGTTPELIKKYRALGFENLQLEDIVSAVATGTTPEFITSMRQKGHNMQTLEKYITLKAVLE